MLQVGGRVAPWRDLSVTLSQTPWPASRPFAARYRFKMAPVLAQGTCWWCGRRMQSGAACSCGRVYHAADESDPRPRRLGEGIA